MFGLGGKTETEKTIPQSNDIIFDVGTEDFEQRVITASMNVPVIVDFWAPWCGPCKQLAPVLEKVVKEAGGKVVLAKVNLDENQQLAAALRVQSVPTVFGFFQGQPVDAFMGAQPESQIKAFIKKLITAAINSDPDAIHIPEALKAAAEALSINNFQTAYALYSQILKQDSINADAFAGLIRCFIGIGQIEQAQSLIQNAPDEIAKTSAFEQAKNAVELATVNPSVNTEDLKAAIQKNPKDHQAYIDLAQALYASGAKEEAVDTLLQSIEIDLNWNEQATRKELLKLFDAMGPSDPITMSGRRKLSSLLFS
ncbi:MAG: thioredoxin [Alphaproteobacteria bacterium]|nr:thioredoxin [Alphaproteobacteria bacterium]